MNKRKLHRTLVVLTILSAYHCSAQWITGTYGEQFLRTPTEGAWIGTVGGFPPSSLTIRGDEMTHPTGEVLRTDAPGDQDTYWRMFQGGKEYGTLFHVDNTQNLDLDAVVGHLRFHANDSLRMQLNTSQLVNFGHGLSV